MTTSEASLRSVVVAGVGMTAFGKFLDRSIKSLVAESVQAAIKDSGMGDSDKGIETIYYANTASGILQGQHSVRGQHAVREAGLNGIPLINIENACASGSTALNQAWLAVASGYVDVALAVGAEKLYHPDKALTFAAMGSALDQDRLTEIFAEIDAGGGDNRSSWTSTRKPPPTTWTVPEPPRRISPALRSRTITTVRLIPRRSTGLVLPSRRCWQRARFPVR